MTNSAHAAKKQIIMVMSTRLSAIVSQCLCTIALVSFVILITHFTQFYTVCREPQMKIIGKTYCATVRRIVIIVLISQTIVWSWSIISLSCRFFICSCYKTITQSNTQWLRSVTR